MFWLVPVCVIDLGTTPYEKNYVKSQEIPAISTATFSSDGKLH